MPGFTDPSFFQGKTALVTGAAGSLGMATTRMLLNTGLKVVMVDIAAEKLDALAKEVEGVSVPWAFAEELYQLRVHIELVRARLERRGSGDDAL